MGFSKGLDEIQQYIEDLELKYKAKVISGPYQLHDFFDPFNNQASIHLTSPYFLKNRLKKFLIHFKSQKLNAGVNKTCSLLNTHISNSDKNSKSKDSNIEANIPFSPKSSIYPNNNHLSDEGKKFENNYSKQTTNKVENFLMESHVSISIKKFSKTYMSKENLNRKTMLKSSILYKNLVSNLITEYIFSSPLVENFRKHLIFDLILYILNYLKDPSYYRWKIKLLTLIKNNLESIVEKCLLHQDRTISHKCSRLLTTCLLTLDKATFPEDLSSLKISFENVLFQQLLSNIKTLPFCPSSYSITYFFTILNYLIKHDPHLIAKHCYDLLIQVTSNFQHNEYHDFLRTNFGLYGTPLEPDLFEISPVLINSSLVFLANDVSSSRIHQAKTTQPPDLKLSYASITGGNIPNSFQTSSFNSFTSSMFPKKTLFEDILNLVEFERRGGCELNTSLKECSAGASGGLMASKEEYLSRFLVGLIEVEPLNFSIHSTSDGTKVEKIPTSSAFQSFMNSHLQPSLLEYDPLTTYPMDSTFTSNLFNNKLNNSLFGNDNFSELYMKELTLFKLQMHKKLKQKLNNESKNLILGSETSNSDKILKGFSYQSPFDTSPPFNFLVESFQNPKQDFQTYFSNKLHTNNIQSSKSTSEFNLPLEQRPKNPFQLPIPQNIIIDKSSGMRKFVVLDFGSNVCLTDLFFPFCSDIVSVAIDTWTRSEESDGQRLVESTDIKEHNLILNDILPPVVLRYLKITLQRMHGGSCNKLKIPIGSYFGHVFISPWQQLTKSKIHKKDSLWQKVYNDKQEQYEKNMIFENGKEEDQLFSDFKKEARLLLYSYLNIFEDIETSYSMSRCKLKQMIEEVRAKRKTFRNLLLPSCTYTNQEEKLISLYHESLQHQIQWNLAKKSIERLQLMAGMTSINFEESGVKELFMLSTDKLRFLGDQLTEFLFNVINNYHPSSSQSFSSINLINNIESADWLFKHLCVDNCRPRQQLACGLLLMKQCCGFKWWGDLICEILVKFFNAERKINFPQDRLFLILVYLGQCSLANIKSSKSLLVSLFNLINQLISPLISKEDVLNKRQTEVFDFNLLCWVLSFLSKCFDFMSSSIICREGDDPQKNDIILQMPAQFNMSNRWSFLTPDFYFWKVENEIQPLNNFSENFFKKSIQTNTQSSFPDFSLFKESPIKSNSSSNISNKKKILNKIIQNKLKHSSRFMNCTFLDSNSVGNKKHLWKHNSFKNSNVLKTKPKKKNNEINNSKFKNDNNKDDSTSKNFNKNNFSSGFFNFENVLGGSSNETFQSFNKDENSNLNNNFSSTSTFSRNNNFQIDDNWILQEWNPLALIERSKCLLVSKSLASAILILSKRSSIDLFVLSCKLLSRIMKNTHPVIHLSEVMTPEEVNNLLEITCGVSISDNVSLLNVVSAFFQDLLEGEKLQDIYAGSSVVNNSSHLPISNFIFSNRKFNSNENNNNNVFSSEKQFPIEEKEPFLSFSFSESSPEDDGANQEKYESCKEEESDEYDNEFDSEGSENFQENELILSGKDSKNFMNMIKEFDLYSTMFGVEAAQEFFELQSTFNDFSEESNIKKIFPFVDKELNKSNNNKNCDNFMGYINKIFSKNSKNLSKAQSSYTFNLNSNSFLDYFPMGIHQNVSYAIDSRENNSNLSDLFLKTLVAFQANNTYQNYQKSFDDKKYVELVPDENFEIRTSNLLSNCISSFIINHSNDKASIFPILDLFLSINDPSQYIFSVEPENSFSQKTIPFVVINDEAMKNLFSIFIKSVHISHNSWIQFFRSFTLIANHGLFNKINNELDSSKGYFFSEDVNFFEVLKKFMTTSGQNVGSLVVKAFHEFISCPSLHHELEHFSFTNNLLNLISSLIQESYFQKNLVPLDIYCCLIADVMSFIKNKNIFVSFEDYYIKNNLKEKLILKGYVVSEFLKGVISEVKSYLAIFNEIGWKKSETSTVDPRNCFMGFLDFLEEKPEVKNNKYFHETGSQEESLVQLLKLSNLLLDLPLLEEQTNEKNKYNVSNTSIYNKNTIDYDQNESCSQNNFFESTFVSDANEDTNVLKKEKRSVIHYIINESEFLLYELYSCLSCCTCNKLISFLESKKIMEILNCSDFHKSLTVGDLVFEILCNIKSKSFSLKKIINSLRVFLLSIKPNNHLFSTSNIVNLSFPRKDKLTIILSEPLLLFCFKVLDCSSSVDLLLEKDMIQKICYNIISSYQLQSFPSIITSIDQYFSSPKLLEASSKLKFASSLGLSSFSNLNQSPFERSEDYGQLLNFAPLGKISSSNSQACSSQILIQELPAPRRTKTAVWNHVFSSGDHWLDLTISLPCPVLLIEVIIVPHFSSLETCPSSVIVEASLNNSNNAIHLGDYIMSSGLTNIKIKLRRSQLVSVVTIKLKKPKDSHRMSLTQILLIGNLPFGVENSKIELKSIDINNGVEWMRLLHHCLEQSHNSETKQLILDLAGSTEDFLESGFFILKTPLGLINQEVISNILWKVGTKNAKLTSQLLRFLLTQFDLYPAPGSTLLEGLYMKAELMVVDFIFKVGETSISKVDIIQIIMDVIKLHASSAIKSSFQDTTAKTYDYNVKSLYIVASGPSASYIHALACLFWKIVESDSSKILLDQILTFENIKVIFDWSCLLPVSSVLKIALDQFLCSLCHKRSHLFKSILFLIKQQLDDKNQQNFSISKFHLLTNVQLTTLSLISLSNSSLQILEQMHFLNTCCSILNNYFLEKDFSLPCDLIINLLDFLSTLCQFSCVQTWLGRKENILFWEPLLCIFSSSQSMLELYSPDIGAVGESNAKQTTLQLDFSKNLQMKMTAINFFNHVTFLNKNNQFTFCSMLIEIIKSIPSLQSSVCSLPGLLKNLLLQVLLEEEVLDLTIYSPDFPITILSSSATPLAFSHFSHPQFGTGYNWKTIKTSFYFSIEQVVSYLLPNVKIYDVNSEDDSSLDDYANLVSVYLQSNPDKKLNRKMIVAELINFCDQSKENLSSICLCVKKAKFQSEEKDKINVISPFPSILQVFSKLGGLEILAQKIPLIYSGIQNGTQQFSELKQQVNFPLTTFSCSKSSDKWMKVNTSNKVFEGSKDDLNSISSKISNVFSNNNSSILEKNPSNTFTTGSTTTKISSFQIKSDYFHLLSPHSFIAFSLCLKLPGYSEELLKENKKARCLLRIFLNSNNDEDIKILKESSSFSHFPFTVLKNLFDSQPIDSEFGASIRILCVNVGLIHLTLACISVFGHHDCMENISGIYQDFLNIALQSQFHMFGSSSLFKGKRSGTSGDYFASNSINLTNFSSSINFEKSPNYWAKGTGFGTGSTVSNWDGEQLLLKQKAEEKHVTNLLSTIASFIGNNSRKDCSHKDCFKDSLLSDLPDLLRKSCLIPALSSYLRNDSVLDMACHVPLYFALLQVLQNISSHPSLVHLLLQKSENDFDQKQKGSNPSISILLDKMKKCVETYSNKLNSNKNIKKGSPKLPVDEDTESLALLVPVIQKTIIIINRAIDELINSQGTACMIKNKNENLPSHFSKNNEADEKYLSIMKNLQYDTCQLISDSNFKVTHHYESKIKEAKEVNDATRARRLAQEIVTLSTSLPLSTSSSVFIRCDEERLDVMKVLIIGPTDTPYCNGCFEFDVFFPLNYPFSPPLINLQTTGQNSVRFNPNLYNDGKVCLSIINTWHGRPEEKWNAQTSSLLQVLVSIQSLILVQEPYFNEPGYERSKGTESGTLGSKEYDANIRQATVRWGMLDMILNPSPAFKEIIYWHFWLKREEIITQIKNWVKEMEIFSTEPRIGKKITIHLNELKKNFNILTMELEKLLPPQEPESAEYKLSSTSSSEDEDETKYKKNI